VATGWHKLARVFRMDWEEVSTRLAQEMHKRADLARYGLGMKPGLIAITGTAAEGRFFFERTEASERATLVRQALPERAAEIVDEADEICRHHFRLLGYDALDFGPGIDWHLDRVHNQRAPLEAWFGIPFLDFAVVGDHKVIWELNRHQHLVTLAKAWQLTRDEMYLRELMGQWQSWQKANPYPLGINWGSTLEVAFRSLSWVWVDHLISDAPDYREFRNDLLPTLAFHGRYIERYLSTYFSPNTHLLGEAVAMFFLGTLYPQLPGAAGWKKKGWEVVVREATRQVRPDGVYFEQSLYYHVYALDFFHYARLLAAENGLVIPREYDEVLLKMLNVVQALAQAGPAEGFGDDDGGRVFDARRNHTEDLTDPLAIGTAIFDRHDFRAARLTEESIWLFGERAIENLRHPVAHPAGKSIAFPDGGIYVLAASSLFPQTMMVDAGPQGVGRCGHGHADALSVRLTMAGKRWLIDSGSGVYISSGRQERNSFRGTAAHNTMLVDGLDQATPEEPFSWTDIPNTNAERWAAGKSFSYFRGSHDGYKRLEDPVIHSRSILRVNGTDDEGFWLIRDSLSGNARHEVEQNWHFASELSLEQINESEFAATSPEKDQPLVRIVLAGQTAWKTEILQGRVSPAYGRHQTAPVLRCHARVKLPTEFAAVLIAEARNARQRHELGLSSNELPLVEVYELHEGELRHEFFFARSKQMWSAGAWSSDADMIYCQNKDQRLTQLIVIGASRVAWDEQELFEAKEPIEFFEWRSSDGLKNAVPVTAATTAQFDELTQTLKMASHSSNSTSSYAEKR
jgi:hypothetical protein